MTRSRHSEKGYVYLIKRLLRLLFLKFMRLTDSTETIAKGVGIGLFVAFTPTIGLQMAISVVVCLPFRASKLAAMLMCWITNPVTIIPIYGLNFVIGKWLYGKSVPFDSAALVSWERFMAAGSDFIVTLWIGSLVVGIFLGILGYILTLKYYAPLKSRFLKETIERLRRRRRRKEIEQP